MKKKRSVVLLISALTAAALSTGCGGTGTVQAETIPASTARVESADSLTAPVGDANTDVITPGTEIRQLENGLSAVNYEGDYWFSQFLEQGGASSDSDVIGFITGRLQLGSADIGFGTEGFGCSTLAVKNPEGEALFGRNFDWQNCEAMIVKSAPSDGYASLSTVNMDFIRTGYGESPSPAFGGKSGAGLSELPDEIRTLIALYAPLDGMNEKGLAVSVNMIQDSAVISQDTGKPDITTTTAIRMLLDRAADVEEALAMLRQYDMHSSMGMMVHFALADRSGRSVVVEYVNNEMVVTDTPAVTNFYLAPGEKQGIGTSQSHTRYEILMKRLTETNTMGMDEVRDALDSVSKDNFGEFESTEWSIVFNLEQGEARYYHRENYENSYLFQVNEQAG
ncbi:linear amide C-N hydrolase [Clostridium transplantifaecale]|uniref:linear amide C-N hydrolase n=1 Tax=Clostridium transplantifaecale TaxID=2479838 RepID=UPI000F634811|nr:C45 family peptidase [Clostridium transplantifaecale]